MGKDYLGVFKASYDYVSQSDDEVSIKEDQILFLVERVDEEWWKVKVKQDGLEDKGPVGLVPASYVEEASVIASTKAQYDYEASAPGELTIKEDEELIIYDREEEWLLVKVKRAERAGYVPANYCDEDADAAVEEEPAPTPAPAAASHYNDPEELVASSRPSGKVDTIQTWTVSEVDSKGKKKKGTLGIGNGSIFFASDSDKAPVQKWDTKDITSVKTEKSKHVHIEVGGSKAVSLHYHATSKEIEGIVDKIESSRALSTTLSPSKTPSPGPESNATTRRTLPPPLAIPTQPPESKKGVHFRGSPASIIPSPPDRDDGSEIGEEEEEGEGAAALYDFAADGEDELTVRSGERLRVIDRTNDEWWKCRNSYGAEGVVPASYVDLEDPIKGSATQSKNGDDGEEERARLQAEQEEEERKEEERKAKEARERKAREEADRKAKAAAAAAAADRKKKEEERRKREQEKEEEEERERQEQEDREREQAAKRAAQAKRQSEERRQSEESGRKARPPSTSSTSSPAKGPEKERRKPDGSKVRTWHDRTGQFQVDAEFLGFNNGLIRLHKTNGVIIEVPSEKMSAEDMQYIDNHRRKAAEQRARVSRDSRDGDDDVPLGNLKGGQQPQRKPTAAPERQKDLPRPKKPTVDWFDWFLNAGCDMDDCTRYAASFERDKIDETLLLDLKESTLRSLGLREGDIIRVQKSIESQRAASGSQKRNNEQVRRDEELARQLQAEENMGISDPKRSSTTSPAPNLFAGADGVLKPARRGRPTPSKSAPPTNVDLGSIGSVSSDASRSPAATPPPRVTTSPVPAPPPKTLGGFDDEAWAPRPSKSPVPPVVAATPPPVAPTPPPPPPAPVVAAPTTAPAPVPAAPAQPPQTSPAPSAQDQATFDILAKISSYRPPSAPVHPSQPAVSPPPQIVTPPGYQAGMGMGSSNLPIGQHLQAQATGILPQLNGPRAPFAPVVSNAPLLQPLVPTTTGFGGFVPTRPQSNPGPSFHASSALSPFGNQFAVSQPMLPQTTGFPMQQMQMQTPLQFQATGMPSQGGFSQFGSNPGMLGGSSFGGVQTNPTGFMQTNPTGYGSFGGSSFGAPPPVPPLPASPPTQNSAPSNIFAQMKAGTFAAEDQSGPQSADKYDALRQPMGGMAPQATGWGQPQMTGYQTYGYQQH